MTYIFEMPDWCSAFRKNIDKIDIPEKCNYLEIGMCEGRSATYMLDKFPDLKYTGIDITLNQNLLKNIAKHHKDNRTKLILGKSQKCLPSLEEKYDVIYIDGAHKYESVFWDSIFSFSAIKRNGIIIWDDYGFDDVKKAVDEILGRIPIDYKELFTNWQKGIVCDK